jgi:iron complex outermembrane recepter protein
MKRNLEIHRGTPISSSAGPKDNPKDSSSIRPFKLALLPALLAALPALPLPGYAQQRLDSVVISANRMEQQRFDAAASVDAVDVDALHANGPLVNLSELMGAVPGLQLRERQNYAQDLQLSVRGFGTRSTFGVRGIRILIDGIPATMPDGQGQAATANLASAQRIEVLRGPVAQLYGNASGGVVQVFTKDPPLTTGKNGASASVGAGSDGQRQLGAGFAIGTDNAGGLLDLTHYRTDGYRDHSAAERNQLNGKAVWKLGDTTLTGVLNAFHQPLAQDPLGLTRAQFEQDPRQATSAAYTFDTRKRIEQQQLGLLAEHRLGQQDRLNARLYAGTREVFQTLAMSGVAATSSGGVVDLDNRYQGTSLSWSHKGSGIGIDTSALGWTVGVEADELKQERRGYVNNNGTPGALRRDETDRASNVDLFGQLDWAFAERWSATAGLRSSRVRLTVDDRYVTAASPNDSGNVEFRNTSPVAGIVWHARDDINVYANIGKGFETPTITEIAYRAGGTGPNFSLRPSRSVQAEAGIKWRRERETVDLAVFRSRSEDEIVPFINDNGRSIFQNVDEVTRQGIEATWKRDWQLFTTRMAYTFLDAEFGNAYRSGTGATAATVAAGNRLPGAPRHSLFAQIEMRPAAGLTLGAETRIESQAYVDDLNSDAASGYAVLNLFAGKTFKNASSEWHLFGRIDNVLDRQYAGSVIVNESNRRFFEPAAGRRFFIGLRTSL